MLLWRSKTRNARGWHLPANILRSAHALVGVGLGDVAVNTRFESVYPHFEELDALHIRHTSHELLPFHADPLHTQGGKKSDTTARRGKVLIDWIRTVSTTSEIKRHRPTKVVMIAPL